MTLLPDAGSGVRDAERLFRAQRFRAQRTLPALAGLSANGFATDNFGTF